MSKYLGPKWKKARSIGISLRGDKKEFKKRVNQPGQHGAKRKRKKSSYGQQLQEKQKSMYIYGWRDKQLKNEYIKVKSAAGDKGVNLLISSESRLDNLVFRSGLAKTLGFARQLVTHEHVLVNGKVVKSPSYKVELGQIISLKKEKMKENKIIKNGLEQNVKFPPYVAFDKEKLTITYLRYPMAEELNKDIDASLVVEWYNRRT